MYSYEDRIKAVELYIKYDKSAAATVQELGYPSYKMLIRWYKEFKETGALHEKFTRSSTYTSDQMKAAVNYYLEHGRCISRTVRAIGYPTRETLADGLTNWFPVSGRFVLDVALCYNFLKSRKKMQ